MNRRLKLILAACAAGFYAIAPSPGRADLFALGTSVGELHRIDSDSGQILNTYSIPAWSPTPPTSAGLAFDGRIVYLSNRAGAPPDLLRFDAFAEVWLPPVFAAPFIGSENVAGLGFLRQYDIPTLFTVLWNGFAELPLEVFKTELFGDVGMTLPFSTLPPNLVGLGLDIDPQTGEIWIAAQIRSTVDAVLIQLDSAGEVVHQIPLMLDALPGRIARGLAFDDGRMYVATTSRLVYEIDRTTGRVLRSFALRVDGLIGGLTGGEVVPEPASATLAMAAAAALLGSRRTRRRPV